MAFRPGKILALTTFLFMSSGMAAQAAPETYNFDASHTNIIWHANHFGFSNPSGRFGLESGTLVLDEQDPAASKLDVTIDASGLVTGIPKFDEHLKSADFLDTAQFPSATFKSTKIDVTGDKTAKVHGDLTLHGVTKPVVLDVTLNKIAPSPMTQKKTAGFSATTTIRRSEFGIDKYVPNISDEVTIAIEAEANLAGAAAE